MVLSDPFAPSRPGMALGSRQELNVIWYQNTSHHPARLGDIISRGRSVLGVVHELVVLPGEKTTLVTRGYTPARLGRAAQKGEPLGFGIVVEPGPEDGLSMIFVDITPSAWYAVPTLSDLGLE